MKICMVVWKYFPCEEGGAERQCRKIVAELSKRGDVCTVITAHIEKKSFSKESFGGGLIVRLGTLSWIENITKRTLFSLKRTLGLVHRESGAIEFWASLPFTILARLSFMLSLRNYIRKNQAQIDLIHVHEAHWIAGAVAWANVGINLPIVCKEATYPYRASVGFDTPFRRKLTEYRKHMNYIAITEAIRESILENNIKESQVFLIPNGVDVPVDQATVIGSKTVLYIGNFSQGSKNKAFDILFQAWMRVCKTRQDLSLLVLGGGDHAIWKQLLEDHQCLESVNFKGTVPDVGKYLKQSRLFLLPSRQEGLSNALLEAMSWGVPAIISDIPSHRDLIQDRVNGIVVPVNDIEKLAQSILALAKDDTLSLALSHKARETIKENYSIEHVVTSLSELYVSLINRQESISN